jgi:hypothetical protein
MAEESEHTHVSTEELSTELGGGLTFCVNHPHVETALRCNKCGDPICARCAVHTPVGYRCERCILDQQSIFFTGLPTDYIIAAVVSLLLAAVGAYIASYLGIFFAIFIGMGAGALVSDLTWRAVGRRRSRYLWLVVCGGIILATLGVSLYQYGAFSGRLIRIGSIFQLDLIIYAALAVSAAYGRLRLA